MYSETHFIFMLFEKNFGFMLFARMLFGISPLQSCVKMQRNNQTKEME